MNATAVNVTEDDLPLPMLAFKPIAILICAAIGIPLNGLIAMIIITSERLHRPRNIFWLGVTFSNLFALATSLVEFSALYGASEAACTVYVLLLGIPYATLLLNLLLALMDRFVAITYPMWHKDKVTSKVIFVVQIAGLVIIGLLFKVPLLLDQVRLSDIPCGDNQPHGKIIVFTLLALVLLCILAQIVVYLKARSYFGQQRDGLPSRYNDVPQNPSFPWFYVRYFA